MRPLSPLTTALVATNVVVYFFVGAIAAVLHLPVAALALWPVNSGGFEFWQPVTYAFLHSGLAHLGFNMLGLWMFGQPLERLLGTPAFARLYFASVLVAALTQLAVAAALGSGGPTIGASGGVYGVLLGFAIAFPQARVIAFPVPLPLPARFAVVVYAVVELWLGVTGSSDGVAHFAHLGGLLGALVVMGRLQRRR